MQRVFSNDDFASRSGVRGISAALDMDEVCSRAFKRGPVSLCVYICIASCRVSWGVRRGALPYVYQV